MVKLGIFDYYGCNTCNTGATTEGTPTGYSSINKI
jgi:hypothetical protein